MSRVIFALAMSFAAVSITAACENKKNTRSGDRAGAKETTIVSFALPALTAFQLDSGDPSAALDSYWYTVEPENPECGTAQKGGKPYTTSAVDIEVLAECDYEISLAVGKAKKALFKTEDPVGFSGSDTEITMTLTRTSAGKAAGFKAESVDVTASGEDDGHAKEPKRVTFDDLKVILDGHCVSCHARGKSRSDSDLTSYAGAKSFAELLVQYVNGGRMPPPPAAISDAEKTLVQKWKDDGFLDSPGVSPTPSPSPTPGVTPGPTGNIVEFRIKNSTGLGPWNTSANPISARVGQTIRVFNDDSQPHQMHTDGAPCQHGNLMEPGDSDDCVVKQPFNGRLYDHGTDGDIYIKAVP